MKAMNNQKSGLDTENIGCLTDNGQLGLQAIKGQVWAICFHARSVSWTKLVVQLIVKSLMTQEPVPVNGAIRMSRSSRRRQMKRRVVERLWLDVVLRRFMTMEIHSVASHKRAKSMENRACLIRF
jgi:hypothetical protein